MITFEKFLKEEVNDYIKDLILKSIKQGKIENKFREELIFNRYSLEFLFEESKVIIYDDVFSEDKPLELELDKFVTVLSGL
ncbi:hypothetical protein WIW50_10110 [Flavobacteriaceae bacterium 3-367]